MKAKDARKTSIDSCKSEINEILERIKIASNNGQTKIKATIKDGTKLYLRELGYNVIDPALSIEMTTIVW